MGALLHLELGTVPDYGGARTPPVSADLYRSGRTPTCVFSFISIGFAQIRQFSGQIRRSKSTVNRSEAYFSCHKSQMSLIVR